MAKRKATTKRMRKQRDKEIKPLSLNKILRGLPREVSGNGKEVGSDGRYAKEGEIGRKG